MRSSRPHTTKWKYLLAMLMLLLGSARLQAQTDINLSQYWAIPTFHNPAATGEEDFLRIRGGARLQWLGIKHAPQSFIGTADIPFQIGKTRIGAGVNLSQESLGLFSNLSVNGQLSYKFKILKGQLSVGVQGGYFNQKFKGTEIVTPDNDDYHQGSDEGLPTQDLTGSTIDLGAGLKYTHKYFYVGIAGMHLLQPSVNMKLQGTESNETQEYFTELPRMFYFDAGCNIPIKNTLFEMQPSLMVTTDLNAFTAEVTARGRYNKFISAGVGYRWKDAVIVTVGVDIKDFYLGYAFDYPLSAIGRASSGSHELVAGYRIKLDFSGKNKNKHRSIRLM